VLHLFEVRKIIEPRAAWLAATRADERQLAEIEIARQRLERHDQDWKLAGRLDIEFHRTILRGAQNPALEAIHDFVMAGLLASRATMIRFTPDLTSSRQAHREIASAVLRRQADAAEQAMKNHLDASSQELFETR